MTEQLLEYLKDEAVLLDEVIELSEKQQTALVAFELKGLSKHTDLLEKTVNKLNDATLNRVEFVAEALHIEIHEAKRLKLSEYEDFFELGEKGESIRNHFKEKTDKMYSINAINRMLANRASHSVKDMIGIMMSGQRKVCNVRV